MADPVSYANSERDIEQAIITLKKGTQLIKYSRKGKPKFCPFRISADATTLIWLSHGDERNLKVSSVQRIIPGQRTAVFKRYLRPEKDYLSFSLLYNNGERSLDLICKDKVEAEVWFAGLKALISTGGRGRTRSDISDFHDDASQNSRAFGATLELTSSIARGRVSFDLNSREPFLNSASSDAGSERASMQLRTSPGDGFRISVSSTPSCSSQASGPDDIESLGDVYVWGAVWADGGMDGSVSSNPSKIDVLTPKPLESNVVLDVHQISCGVRHIALVTRQGEVFTWGEENGGRLGHGVVKDFSRPHLVEYLAVTNVDAIACGEYHTCAVSTLGDLFTWGDGAHNAGLLGHGSDASHWIPKRVSGALEGLQVISVACGTWHSALATSNGKLFTFGDGTLGVLGHGDRESVSHPKEVQLLNGLKTIKVACGVWHTAAIVEVTNQTGAHVSSRKLFTWGDGDKYRLGHGNKETYLLPTCVSALIDYNFHQLACGHSMTVALTTSGHVFTMGGTAHGQLGNPQADGKSPSLVQDKLVGEFVEEISCGAHHVAVLTTRSEVFTWGKGANGRLGHGDLEDRKVPTLVEALRDRHVKSISCGSNFSSSICIHKWVSGADQSICSGCRQAFGFTKKRHNCYNCGLVHCHACSSKKALKAALAPTPGKPHRVCDSCYAKLKAAEAGNTAASSRKICGPRRSVDIRDKFVPGEIRSSKILLSPVTEPTKYLDMMRGKTASRADSPSVNRTAPGMINLADIDLPTTLTSLQSAFKPDPPPVSSRPASPAPYTRRSSPTRSSTPVVSRGVIDSLKKSNELLNQEVTKLQNQVRSLKQKCEVRDLEIHKLNKNAEKAVSLATEKSSKWTTAKEVIKSITAQLKEISDKLPPELCESDSLKAIHAEAEAFVNANDAPEAEVCHSFASQSDGEQHNDHLGSAEVNSVKNPLNGSRAEAFDAHVDSHQSTTNDSTLPPTSSTAKKDGRSEVIEQFEPGVYVTLILLQDGTKVFKRVRFSKRKFDEHQAEEWWKENKDRVLKKYSPPIPNTTPSPPPPPNDPLPPAEESSDTS